MFWGSLLWANNINPKPRGKGKECFMASQGTTRPTEVMPGLLMTLVVSNMAFGEDNLAVDKSRTLTDREFLNTFAY